MNQNINSQGCRLNFLTLSFPGMWGQSQLFVVNSAGTEMGGEGNSGGGDPGSLGNFFTFADGKGDLTPF